MPDLEVGIVNNRVLDLVTENYATNVFGTFLVLKLCGVHADHHQLVGVFLLQLLEVADRDLGPAVVRLDPSQHAYRVALGEAPAQQVDVVPDHGRHAAGAVCQLQRQEGIAVSGAPMALALHGEGRLPPPGVLGAPVDGGGFHVKAAILPGGKRNWSWPHNGRKPAP